MSFLRPVDCPRCGAPLPPDAIGASVATCPYCDGTLAADPRVVWAAKYERALEAPEDRDDLVLVGARPYFLEGLVAEGESSDVHLARRATTPTERVILKVPRTPADAGRLAHEWSVLEALHDSDTLGATHFSRLLPQLVERGAFADPRPACGGSASGSQIASVMRFADGFVHTLVDVRTAFGDGLDPRHAAWIWRRALELLTFVHHAGYEHGALHPEHFLLHARDHGVMFVGFSKAAPLVDPSRDLQTLAETISSLCPLPAPLAAVAATPCADAWHLVTLVKQAARECFGPPRYVSLRL